MLSIQTLYLAFLCLFLSLFSLLFGVLLDVRLELCYPIKGLVRSKDLDGMTMTYSSGVTTFHSIVFSL
jgi:hypothetical protein